MRRPTMVSGPSGTGSDRELCRGFKSISALSAISWEASSDSTSARVSSSLQASCRNTARWIGSRSKASPKRSLICSHLSGFTVLLLTKLPGQRRLGHTPISFHRGGGNTEELGHLLHRQAAEHAEFNDPRLLRIDRGEPGESFIQGHEVVRAFLRESDNVI